MNGFTIILRRPDYITTDPYDSVYITTTYAETPEAALAYARSEAAAADGEGVDKDDYALTAIFAGCHTAIYIDE